MRIAVLASGSGTLLEAILDDGIPVSLVVVDRPSKAQGVAEAHGVEAVARGAHELRRRLRPGRLHRRRSSTCCEPHDVELVVMAGFGTIFGDAIHDAFPDRILNTHPALLPVVQGLARACGTRSPTA